MYGLMLLFNALFQTSTIFRNSQLLKLDIIEYFKSPYPVFFFFFFFWGGGVWGGNFKLS